MFEEDDINLMMLVLDALAEGTHGHGRRLENIAENYGATVEQINEAHDRIAKALGQDNFWKEDE